MPQSDIATWLKFALQQMAAESYLDNIDLNIPEEVVRRLLLGNNREGFPETGFTRFTGTVAQGQAKDFTQRYQIVDHHANDATGFSATLMRDTQTGQYTLSFRSLEYQNQAQGGDWERDGQGGAAGEIAGAGFALGQLVSMQRYFADLEQGRLTNGAIDPALQAFFADTANTINVSGYSLGGHLATVFTLLHSSRVSHTYIFNGAGIGQVSGVTPVVTEADRIQQLIQAMDAKFVEFDPTGSLTRSGSNTNVQNVSWYQPAVMQVAGQFGTTGTASLPTGGLNGGITRTDGAFNKITQLFGSSVTGGDVQLVANSGMHGPIQSVLIEGQPLMEGLPNPFRDYGNAHSVTLIVDSLALQALFERLDHDLIQTDIENIFQAASPARADVTAFSTEKHTAEGDTLERALDILRAIFIPNAADKITDFNDDTGGFGDLGARTEFYTHLAEVQATTANQTFSIESLVQRDAQGRVVPRLTAEELAAAAQDPGDSGLAYRYALRALNPFAVVGADYVGLGHTTDGRLALYDSATGLGELTDQYLTDRAAFLLAKLDLTLHNQTYPTDLLASTHYHDVTSGFDVPSALLLPAFSQREYLFGGTNSDVLAGHELTDDHLYGSGGNDRLVGQGGDDYLQGDSGADRLDGGTGNDRLEGGTGFDTYVYTTGDGNDRIEDSAADGVIFVNGQMLVGGVKKAGHTDWVSADGTIRYEMSGTDLVVKLNGTQIMTVNENFQSGQFGIRLIDANALPAGLPTVARTIEGDHEPKDFNPDPEIVEWRADALGNFLYDPGAPVPYQDILRGSGGSDRIDAGEMRDYLLGFGGDDVLVGGAGNDRLLGGDGNDFLFSDGVVDLAGLPSLDTFTGVGTQQELLNGDADNDVLVGGAVGDALFGASGADLLLGGAGDDFLAGDANWQPDLIPNGWGFSFMPGGDLGVTFTGLVQAGPNDTDQFGQADEIYGGAGTDLIWGGGGNDLLYGGQGDDRITGDGGDDAILGGNGNDQLQGDQPTTAVPSNDYIDGGNGDDIVIGGYGDDVLVGGAGSDLLYGEATNLLGVAGNDVLDGGDGNDALYGHGGDDTLLGGAGDDELFGDFSNDTVPGNDRLFGDAGADLLQGEAGDDELDGGDDNDVVLGGAGNDVLFGEAGDDVLLGESTSFQGVAGDDLLDGGDGDDELQGSGGADTLWGGAGNDQLFGDDPSDVSTAGGNDWLDGEDGIDELQGGLGNDTLFGGEGDDVLFGDRTALDPTPSNGGADVLDGEAGNDNLFGDSGNDVLTGGIGNDSLDGGAGQDTYVFNLGDGVDTIQEAVEEDNRLVFGDGVGVESVTLGIESGDTLLIRAGNASDVVRIAGFGVNTPTGAHPIDHFEFADGTVLTYSQLVERGFHQYGTAGSESLVGSGFIDHIEAGAGHDVVSGLAGADTLLGEDGNDVLRGDAGDDLLDGGAGNDQLFGGDGADLLYGGVGDDLLNADTGADQLFGGIGNDTYVVSEVGQTIVESASEGIDTVQVRLPGSFTYVLPGNVDNAELVGDVYFPSDRVDLVGNQLDNRMTGSDLLNGGQGNDTLIGLGDNIYVFGRGDGQDVIQTGVQTYATAGFVDYIQLLPGIAPADLSFEGLGNHLVLKVVGTTDQLTVENFLIEPGLRTPTIGGIHFADGTVWDESEITSRIGVMTGTSGNDNLTGFGNDNNLFGLGGNDQLVGYGSNDRLDGGLGDDLLVGGDGNDTYLFGRGGGQDRVSDFPDSGVAGEADTVFLDSTVTPTDIRLQATADYGLLLTINGSTDSLMIEGYFYGSLYQIEQIQFSDSTIWNASAIASRIEGLTIVGTEGDDALVGIQTNDTLLGLGGNDTLNGGSGNDTLDGGSGADTMAGGTGNDLYFVDNSGDMVTEQTGQGTDTVNAAITYTLGTNLEHLTLTGTNAINGTGNSGNNTLTGNSAANVLTGGTGNDMYVVGAGDTVVELASGGTDTVQSAVSWTLGSNVENLTLTGTPASNGTGNTLNNTLTGNDANNILDGGAGADSMVGGVGDDTYLVDNIGDVITENLSSGIDTVQSSITYTLVGNVERLLLTGTTAINGTGNTLNNELIGNSGANVLNGGVGADAMAGGAGNDTYVVDDVGDLITENVNEGTDLVQSSVSHTLAGNVENLTLTGTGTINGTGNGLNNTITGNNGNNILDGGAGADALAGGIGNDTYVVDNTSDTVTELASAGTDTVQSAVTFTLGANIENLTLTGTSAINGTGNALNNNLIGNSGANVLSGGTGSDTMSGGAGDDTYIVEVIGDVVSELANEGTDTVQSAITHTLGSNVENLTLTGTSAINGTGNALDNILTGNSGVNVLTGGAGNDTYVVGTGDSVTEAASAGTDTVQSAITWTLGVNTENLTLIGSSTINGTGNTVNNTMAGNSANNTLTGLGGNDTYLYGRGGGQDTVIDNSGMADTMLFGATINPLDLVLSRQANDLRLTIHGSTDSVTIKNWYTSPTTNQVEAIQAGNGQTMLNTQVDQLIQAMVTFTQQTGLTWDQAIDQRPQDVATFLAASWQ